MDLHGLIVGVLQQRHAEEDVGVADDAAAEKLHHLRHILKAAGMAEFSALLLGQANGEHLHQARLIGAAEGGVRLDAVADDDAVGLGRVLVDLHRIAVVRGAADHLRFHRAAHRAAHVFRSDAVARQHLALPFGERAAVTAHRRHDERFRAHLLDKIDDALDDGRVIADAAAARADGDAHARTDEAADLLLMELFVRYRRHVLDRRIVKLLTHAHHLRDLHPLHQFADNTHENTPLYFALALEILVGVCYTCSRLIYLYS